MGIHQKDGDKLFDVVCDEPEGKVTRSVYRVIFTPENLEKLYDKAKQFSTLMGWEIPTKEHFCLIFMQPNPDGSFSSNGLCARIDDWVGIFWLSDINTTKPPFSASVHYTFFDRRHKGRLELCRKALEWLFETYKFHRLWTQAPKFNDKALWFLECIGFRKEGVMIQSMEYKGVKFDSNLYALTVDEIKNGEMAERGNKVVKRLESYNERKKHGTEQR